MLVLKPLALIAAAFAIAGVAAPVEPRAAALDAAAEDAALEAEDGQVETAAAADTAAAAASGRRGEATYYYQRGNAGSCGHKHTDKAKIVALPPRFMKESCNRKVRVKYGSKSVTATVRDTCPGCAGNHIDLSVGAFKALAPLSKGRINVSWTFVS